MRSFLQSVGQANEESLLEASLADERMEEGGVFKNQIIYLNDFSKKLNRFGIKKVLNQESKESLNDYLNVINKISDLYREKSVYPALKKIIEARLLEL